MVIPRRLFQCEAVGVGAARVDAADLVDDTGEVQEPFGEARLARVHMGEDAQVEGVSRGR